MDDNLIGQNRRGLLVHPYWLNFPVPIFMYALLWGLQYGYGYYFLEPLGLKEGIAAVFFPFLYMRVSRVYAGRQIKVSHTILGLPFKSRILRFSRPNYYLGIIDGKIHNEHGTRECIEIYLCEKGVERKALPLSDIFKTLDHAKEGAERLSQHMDLEVKVLTQAQWNMKRKKSGKATGSNKIPPRNS